MAEQIRHIYIGAESMLTALGDSRATVAAMEAGRGGLRYDGRYGAVAGPVDDRHPMAEIIDGYSRYESLVIHHVANVLKSSGLSLRDAGVRLIISTTKGNVGLLADKGGGPLPDEVFLFESALRIAEYFSAACRPVVISNACISGVSAFVVARNIICASGAEHVVIAGCDVLSEFIVEGFKSFRSVSAAPCRPFDAGRDGLSLGEACGAIILTTSSEIATRPYIELCGGAVTNDAEHISRPSATGKGLYYAIGKTLEQARMTPEDIDFINVHGTATPYNDDMESKAVALAGMSDIPLNSFKGYIGHTLGASGVVETILCAYQLRRNVVYGTLGFKSPGTSCRINASPDHRFGLNAKICLKTASGFGGCNAAIILSMDENHHAAQHPRTRRASVAAEYELPQPDIPFAEFIRQEFRSFRQPDMLFYKMSDLCKALYVAVGHLLENCKPLDGFKPTRRAITVGNRVSSLEADLMHQDIVNRHNDEGASPAVFVYTLPNIATGEICIRHNIQGDNTFFIEDGDGGWTEEYARLLVEYDYADVVICGRCDKLGENWNVKLKIIETEN